MLDEFEFEIETFSNHISNISQTILKITVKNKAKDSTKILSRIHKKWSADIKEGISIWW